jgi:2-methylcitrate dehydratase PrpD
MSQSYASDLVAFLHTLSLDRVPVDVVDQAEACLLDALGCGIFGSQQVWSQLLADEMMNERPSGRSTVIGRTERLAAPAAALCNGTAIHGFELDDLIAESIVHPAAAVIPAALATAEATDATGARLLSAIIAGYEALHRLGVALGVEPARRGFHTASLVGPAAAVVAASVVLDLTREQMLSAIGLACSAAAGIKSFAAGHGGGMVKRLHLGRSAEAGVRMGQLAARGFVGPPSAIDGRFGLLEVFGGSGAVPARLSRGLGEDWAMRDVWFKVYPICGWIQTAVQLLRQLRGPGPLTAGEIGEVRVGVSSYAARNNGEPVPRDTMGAQYSIPYCAAVALLGDPRDPASFSTEAVADPVIREVARRVKIEVDPAVEAVYPAQFGASVVLTLADGRSRQSAVMDCHGTPSDPCSAAERRDKFMLLATKGASAGQAGEIAQAVDTLADAPSVGRLTSALAAATGGNPQAHPRTGS